MWPPPPPHLHPEGRPTAIANSSTDYTVTIPVRSPPTTSKAFRRSSAGSGTPPAAPVFGLDGLEDDFNTAKRRADALRKMAPSCGPAAPNSETLPPHVVVTRYGDGETMQRSGEIPAAMSLVVKGRVRLVVTGSDGAVVPVNTLHEGDFIGQTA